MSPVSYLLLKSGFSFIKKGLTIKSCLSDGVLYHHMEILYIPM